MDLDYEQAALSNNAGFWKILKRRSGKCRSSIGARINFNGTVYRSREDLTTQWAIYISYLYDCSVSDDFDADWKRTVRTLINDTLDNITLDSSVCVSTALVYTLIRSLPRVKAGGIDGVQHEHLIYACDAISPVLARLFTGMLRLGYITADMKRGEILPFVKAVRRGKMTQTITGQLHYLQLYSSYMNSYFSNAVRIVYSDRLTHSKVASKTSWVQYDAFCFTCNTTSCPSTIF